MRGQGLFIGVEMVKPADGSPDTDLAKRVINRLKDKGFLTSNAGVFSNVVKIRPPLVFSQANAARIPGGLGRDDRRTGGMMAVSRPDYAAPARRAQRRLAAY